MRRNFVCADDRYQHYPLERRLIDGVTWFRCHYCGGWTKVAWFYDLEDLEVSVVPEEIWTCKQYEP